MTLAFRPHLNRLSVRPRVHNTDLTQTAMGPFSLRKVFLTFLIHLQNLLV
jgi:hypothetical protein